MPQSVQAARVVLLISFGVLSAVGAGFLWHDSRISLDERPADVAVVYAVLQDLVRHEGQLVFSLPAKPPRRISFNPLLSEQPRGDATTALEWIREQPGWEDLTSEEQAATCQAVRDVFTRSINELELERFRPPDSRIRIAPDRKNDRRDVEYLLLYPIQATLPGYSSDGRTAVVAFQFWELFHPSLGMFVLRQERGRWKVVFRAFITYV